MYKLDRRFCLNSLCGAVKIKTTMKNTFILIYVNQGTIICEYFQYCYHLQRIRFRLFHATIINLIGCYRPFLRVISHTFYISLSTFNCMVKVCIHYPCSLHLCSKVLIIHELCTATLRIMVRCGALWCIMVHLQRYSVLKHAPLHASQQNKCTNN